jgi:glucose/arabinose dehydrogenase
MRTRRLLTALTAGGLLTAGCTADDPGGAGPAASTSASTSATAGAPALEVTVVVDGLDHAWDVVQAPDGTLLVDERGGGLTAVLPDGTVRSVAADFDDPRFAENRRFYTCQGRQREETPDVAVIAWTVDAAWRTAVRVDDPLVRGIPVNSSSGRHGGCRLRFAADGALLVGTGDTAEGTVPQDLDVLGGKVLRLDAATGDPAEGNPFADAPAVWTYGHRNVQGLAVRPRGGQVFAVEHGPDRDDEVNLLEPGGNYGWDPDGGGGYDESVPMTDPDLPGAVPAVWSSGVPTLATSGATFLDGPPWGAYDGLLVIGLLRDTGVLALRLDEDGAVQEELRLAELEDSYGRLRSLTLGVDGALYVTTDNGGDDKVLRVTPSSE